MNCRQMFLLIQLALVFCLEQLLHSKTKINLVKMSDKYNALMNVK